VDLLLNEAGGAPGVLVPRAGSGVADLLAAGLRLRGLWIGG